MLTMMIVNQLIRPVDYPKLDFIASFRVGLKQTLIRTYHYAIIWSKFTLGQISPFKVIDIFSLFHYSLCHSNYQEINRKPKILLHLLSSGNVPYDNYVTVK